MVERVGQQLGNYQLIQSLGEGGFAEVYLGNHIHLGTQAAIKVLHTQLTSDDVDKFRTEARTIAHLEHPHIVRILDFGVEGKTPFLVMSYAPNGTLRQRYPKGTLLSPDTIVEYVKQIADALQYAHDQKIIHRDIKPENMLLGRRNEILLSDFGIALIAQSSRYQSAQEMAGTMAYMAPEQIQGKPRPASDQYSLGIVVYEWLSGDRPFHGSLTELIGQHLSVPPPPLHEKVPTISPHVEQVVMTTLNKDHKQRFGSVLAFANAFEQASQPKQPELEPESKPVNPASGMIYMNQSRQPTGMNSFLPTIPLSHQTISEVSADMPAQPQTIVPLSGKEGLGQTQEESRHVEKDSSLKEVEHTDKLEEEGVGKAKKTELPSTGFGSSRQHASLSTQATRSSNSQELPLDRGVSVQPTKPGTLRRFVLVGLVGLLIMALISGIAWFTIHQASPTGTIAEFPINTVGGLPQGITAGPDGNLWFTENRSSKIGRISANGTVTEFSVPTSQFYLLGITAGPDNNLWFTETSSNQIGRITTNGSITDYPIPTAYSAPAGIAVGPDRNLWFTESYGSQIGRMTTNGSITEFPIPTPKSFPLGITTGSDGNLWFTENGSGKIGRISANGTVTEFPIPTANSSPREITAGPDGNLWFTDAGSNKIGRITTNGTITEFPVPTQMSSVEGIIAGPDGNLWFTENLSNKIGRITANGSITEFPIPTPKSFPSGITAGPDGNIWFAENGGNKIGRITSGK